MTSPEVSISIDEIVFDGVAVPQGFQESLKAALSASFPTSEQSIEAGVSAVVALAVTSALPAGGPS